MLPPAAMSFSALVSTTAGVFYLWHTYHYDRWRCMLYTKQDWFRALMCQLLLLGVLSFLAYTWLELYVLYEEYYTFLNGRVIPSPWQLWSEKHQDMWRASLYVLCTGWCFMQAVHLEEFLYWGYLMNGVRKSGGPQTSWKRSVFFKVWVIACLSSVALLFGASHIETDNLDMMKAYLFIVGSAISVVLAGWSTALCIFFPYFVENVRKQGASHEVLERLHFFAEMNQIRTVFRWIYSVAFLSLSIDSLTDAKRINKSGFWSDILYLSGHLAIFASTCISVVVLLPRNMTSESLPPASSETIHPMVAYRRPKEFPTHDGFSPRQYFELGNRLNIDRDALTMGLAERASDEAGYELKEKDSNSPRAKAVKFRQDSESDFGHVQYPGKDLGVPAVGVDVVDNDLPPFSSAADRSRRARFSEMPSLPSVMARFKSPFETASPVLPRGEETKVYVTTQQTVERE